MDQRGLEIGNNSNAELGVIGQKGTENIWSAQLQEIAFEKWLNTSKAKTQNLR